MDVGVGDAARGRSNLADPDYVDAIAFVDERRASRVARAWLDRGRGR
jgi:hypothetical protein